MNFINKLVIHLVEDRAPGFGALHAAQAPAPQVDRPGDWWRASMGAWAHGPAGGRARARRTHTTKGGGAKSHGLPPGGSNSHDWAGPLFLFCSNKPRQPGLFVQERDNREAPKRDHYNTRLTNSLAPRRARKPCHARRSLPMEREPCCVSNQQHGAVCAT